MPRYFFNLMLVMALPALLLLGCGKRQAPTYNRLRSQLLLSACDNITNGQTDSAISDLQRLLDIDPDNAFASAALRHEEQRRLLTEANALLASADFDALRHWHDRVENAGQASPEILALRDISPALSALADFLAHGPWQSAAERQQALAKLDGHLPVLQQSVGFQAFYHTEKEQLASMRGQEQRRLAKRLLGEMDLALFSDEQPRLASLLGEFTAAISGHPLQRYIMQFRNQTTAATLPALLTLDDKAVPAEEAEQAFAIAATLQWQDLTDAVRLAVQNQRRRQPKPVSACDAWLRARADHNPHFYQELFSYLRNLPAPPPLAKDFLEDYLHHVILPQHAVKAWCWRSPAPGVTEFLARIKQVGEKQPVASTKE